MDIGKGAPQLLPDMDVTMGLPPVWIHLLPLGIFRGRDGRGPYNVGDTHGIIRRTLDYFGGSDIPVDYDHQLLFSRENGSPALAAGWIKDIKADNEGIWGKVDWTSRAASYISSREYRYVSPVFRHDENGTVLRLESVGLVNNPNLELISLSSTLGQSMARCALSKASSSEAMDSMNPVRLAGQIRAYMARSQDKGVSISCTDALQAIRQDQMSGHSHSEDYASRLATAATEYKADSAKNGVEMSYATAVAHVLKHVRA